MKNKLVLAILASLGTVLANAQDKDAVNASFSDTVKKYFHYEKLSGIRCSDILPGLYALSFQVDKHGVPHDFQSSSDSLTRLNDLMVEAVKTSSERTLIRKSKNRYLQFFYINILLDCNSSEDTTKLSDNFYSDMAKLLASRLSAIEGSIKTSRINVADYFVLGTAVISDQSIIPQDEKPGFKNDLKQKTFSKPEMDRIEELIQEARNRRSKN